LVLVPSNPIVHSRQWKAQVPFLARHYRVVTFDGRGNGRSDRPVTPEAHTDEECVADLGAVLAATCPEPPVLIGLCSDGVWRSLWFAADHPERVAGVVCLSVGVPRISPPHPSRNGLQFDQVLDRRVRAPLLIVHGDDDRCQPHARAERLAELTGAPLITLEGAGHMLPARHPVKINRLIKGFVDHLIKPQERHRSA
jgi:pimeloyl-ACP methyl ester carboxylesterase